MIKIASDSRTTSVTVSIALAPSLADDHSSRQFSLRKTFPRVSSERLALPPYKRISARPEHEIGAESGNWSRESGVSFLIANSDLHSARESALASGREAEPTRYKLAPCSVTGPATFESPRVRVSRPPPFAGPPPLTISSRAF